MACVSMHFKFHKEFSRQELCNLVLRSCEYSVVPFPSDTAWGILLSHSPAWHSWQHCCLPELMQSQAGETDFKWQAMYGGVVRVRAPFGVCRIHIPLRRPIINFGSQGHTIHPPSISLQVFQATYATRHFPNSVWQGDWIGKCRSKCCLAEDHKQHRKRLPSLDDTTSNQVQWMANKWRDLISSSEKQESIVDISMWTSHATLDAISEASEPWLHRQTAESFPYTLEALPLPLFQ
ncbi:hypothetical protein DFS33DRAFT_1269289 [Desarmillaria ectypa]|nr:hypothetical protein DFS33DRAFT_1269289 [Desarmillaria ectypa]